MPGFDIQSAFLLLILEAVQKLLLSKSASYVLGLDIVVEDSSNKGRVDMTVKFNGHIYLFEFKVVELLPEGKAIDQIKAKGYVDKYRALGQSSHLIGVEFGRESRHIVGFEVEHV